MNQGKNHTIIEKSRVSASVRQITKGNGSKNAVMVN